jgi:hypothetical protein
MLRVSNDMSKVNHDDIDVISLEWTTAPMRDRVSATLVCNYLRLQGLRVKESSVWDGLQAIHESRPRLLFITNTVGALENLEVMRYAKRRNVLGVSLVSEGNFQGDSAYQSEMIWGWNKEKRLHEEITLQWSEVTRQTTLQLHPELEGRVKVSGGVGFDNYKLESKFGIKKNILDKYNKLEYSKVIGVGCWDFGCLYAEDSRFKVFGKLFDAPQIERFKRDSFAFDNVLVELANANKDTLFLLKQHPGVQLGHMASGITKAAQLKNVLVLTNEEPILSCIQVSDIWIVYESTTAMEAWLLGKPTCLLNPSGRDFPRDKLNEGSPAFSSVDQLQRVLNEFYSGNEILGFEERLSTRRQLIKHVIQWDDGLNHVRAGNEIIDLLAMQPRSEWRGESWGEKLNRWKQHAKWMFSPYFRSSESFKGSYANRFNFSFTALEEYQRTKQEQQEAFYRRKGLSLADLRQIRCL